MKHKVVALLGLIGMVPISLGLVRSSLTIETAASRALVLLVICLVADRVVMPLVVAALGPPSAAAVARRRAEDRAASAPAAPVAE